MDVRGQLHTQITLTQGKETPIHTLDITQRTGGWVNPREGLGAVKNRKICKI
jgi:hypothetical protein